MSWRGELLRHELGEALAEADQPGHSREFSVAHFHSPRAICASCRLGDRAGVSGAAITAIEQVLSPAAVDQTLQAAAA
jgi:hypothetical protein